MLIAFDLLLVVVLGLLLYSISARDLGGPAPRTVRERYVVPSIARAVAAALADAAAPAPLESLNQRSVR
ncbi:MAG: hypothetical protein U5R14_05770 [Gemmatimonadota bacterium]|nr:hypothetical protein [Gemmatimonadota bacterium]